MNRLVSLQERIMNFFQLNNQDRRKSSFITKDMLLSPKISIDKFETAIQK